MIICVLAKLKQVRILTRTSIKRIRNMIPDMWYNETEPCLAQISVEL